jgi:hypothetical protein
MIILQQVHKTNRFFLENKIDQLARKAQLVTVGNHWYFDAIKSNNLVYLPTVIDLESYPNFKNFTTEKVTIVWIGSPCTAIYLSCYSCLERLNEKIFYSIKIIGAKIPIVENLKLFYRLEYAN